MICVQIPPMHWSVASQHMCAELQVSSAFEHRGLGWPQMPFGAEAAAAIDARGARDAPSALQGSSAVNAR